MGTTACVTGGGRGIGRAVGLKLAGTAHRVAVVDVCDEKEGAAAVAAFPGAGHVFIQADISVAGDRRRAVETLRREFGRLDLLVNNAGVAPRERRDILETTEESYDRVLGVNLKGTFFLTQEAARWMAAQPEVKEGVRGRIVNVASISSYASSPSRPEYCISKAGVSMVTKLFADRLAADGVLVYEVRPGIIETPMTAGVKEKYDRLILEDGILPQKRWGLPEDVAAVVAAVASGAFDYSTGQVFDVDGGFHLRRL